MNKNYIYDTETYTSPNKKSYYLLGLIASDGTIDGYHIQIHSKDHSLLKKVRNSLVPNKPLYSDKRNDVKWLKISSKEILDFVKKSGITENKSLTLEMNNNILEDKNFNHFVRGYFDGDGTVGISRKTNGTSDKYYYNISARFASGSDKMLKQISKYLNEHYNINQNSVTGKKYYRLQYRGKSAEKLYNVIYKDCDKLYLERKYNRYTNLVLLDNSKLKNYYGKGSEKISELDNKLL